MSRFQADVWEYYTIEREIGADKVKCTFCDRIFHRSQKRAKHHLAVICSGKVPDDIRNKFRALAGVTCSLKRQRPSHNRLPSELNKKLDVWENFTCIFKNDLGITCKNRMKCHYCQKVLFRSAHRARHHLAQLCLGDVPEHIRKKFREAAEIALNGQQLLNINDVTRLVNGRACKKVYRNTSHDLNMEATMTTDDNALSSGGDETIRRATKDADYSSNSEESSDEPEPDGLAAAKKAAADRAVDRHVKDNMVIGIGSGSSIVYVVERLAHRVRKEGLVVICVPTSFQAKQLIRQYALTVSDLEENPSLHVAFNSAEEVDNDLVIIKSNGQDMVQDKIVAYAAAELIIIADSRKQSTALGSVWRKGIPIEVVPMAYINVKRKIEQKYEGDASLRMTKTRSGPCITSNGNYVLDWKFVEKSENRDWKNVSNFIKLIPGVVETGLFVGFSVRAFFGKADGTVFEAARS